MSAHLPEEHSEFGRRQDLHPASYARLVRTALGWGLPLLAVVALLFVFEGPNADRTTMTWVAGVAAVIWLVFVGLAAWETGPAVGVYERGCVIGKVPFAWDEIDAFMQQKLAMRHSGIRVSTSHDYTVRRSDGRKATFYLGTQRADQLAETIQQNVNPRLLAVARRRVATGKVADFGCVKVDAHRLRYQPSDGPPGEIDWPDMLDIQADGFEISVRKRDKWFRIAIPTRKVANLQVLMTLVEELVSASRREQAEEDDGED